MRGVMGARKARTAGFDRTQRINRLTTVMPSQALSVVAIGALLATTLVLSHETPVQASTPADCALDPVGHNPGWSGTERNISSKNDLIWLSLEANRNADNMGANYKLTTDINLGGCNWLPIGSSTVPFTGTFDGLKPGSTTESFTISGLTIANRNDDGNGLFGWVQGANRTDKRAAIRNLNVAGVTLTGVDRATGALVGRMANALVENVHVSGSIDAGEDQDGNPFSAVGGLVGQVSPFNGMAAPAPIEIRSSSVSVNVTGGSELGGLVGIIAGDSRGSLIIDSFATGDVQGESRLGGLIGQLNDSSSSDNPSRSFENRIIRSYATGNVTGTTKIGGLTGETYGVILYSYATGNVTGKDEVGGLAGNFQHEPGRKTPVIKDSYATGDVLRTGDDFDATAGGFLGRLRNPGAPVERSYSIGSVTDGPNNDSAPGVSRVGGFAGYNLNDGNDFDDVTAQLAGNFWNFDTIGQGVPANSIGQFPEDIERAGKVSRSTTAAMTSFDTYQSAGWAIIQGQGTFDAPIDRPENSSGDSIIWGDAVQGTHSVWGIDPQLNCGYPFLLWQTEFLQCSAGGSGAASSGSRERQASAPAIHLDLQANVGDRVSGAPVVVGGEGLSAGSSMTLVVRSTPQTLVSGRVSSLGNFSTRASLPALSPGSHTLTLTGTAPDGAVLTLVQGFVVGADGTFTSIGQPAGSQTGGLAATGVPANAGVLFTVSSLMLLAIGLSLLRARSRHQFTE